MINGVILGSTMVDLFERLQQLA